MKKIATALLPLLVLSLLLASCATKAPDRTKVKCPACGYEFEVPAERP